MITSAAVSAPLLPITCVSDSRHAEPNDVAGGLGGYITTARVRYHTKGIRLECLKYSEMGALTAIQGSSAWTVNSFRLVRNLDRLLDQRLTRVISVNIVAAP